jgi:hypothetical protein
LSLRVQDLHDKIEELKRIALPEIKQAAADAANARGALEVLIDTSRGLFARPRSIIISGITVGLRKGSGKIEFDDADTVIKRIKKFFADAEEQAIYIKTTETLRKKNLESLDAATLKKLGVTVEDTGDVVLIKPVKSDIDKIVNAMLKDSGNEAEELEEAA